MDGGMRDLEQIQEHDRDPDDLSTRRIATILLAALATVALVFSMGVLLGQSADADVRPEADPLDALAALQGVSVERSEDGAEAADDGVTVPEVAAEELAFPEMLETYDPRPEVEATIAAAAAELEYPDPIPGQVARVGVGMEGAAAPLPATPRALPTSLPAAVAVGADRDALVRSRELDPMVREALPEEPERRPAPTGMEGSYTLQVASYPERSDAEEFADELRARGHEAYVVSADIPDRGRYWRVRIGPFETQREVESYRASFETEEGINSYVVRRRDGA